MSISRSEVENRIAIEAGAQETRHMLMLGASARDAITAAYEVRADIIRIAEMPDGSDLQR